MYKILIWGTGYGYSQYINLIKYQELLGEIEVIGVTGKDALYDFLDGYRYIPLNKVIESKPDYIVVTSDINFHVIVETGIKLGLDGDIFIRTCAFLLPGFRFKKYIELKKTKPTIIANNCWGGVAYHALGMEFLSPFINMFEEDEDYLKLLGDLKYYLNMELKFKKYSWNNILSREYPVCELGDVELYFNHYASMEEAEAKWYKRIEKINWDNLFVMMFTSDKDIAAKFDKLDYTKKICFVPFETDLQSAYYMKIVSKEGVKNIPFYEIVNKTASGHYQDYSLVDLLLDGKIEKVRCV